MSRRQERDPRRWAPLRIAPRPTVPWYLRPFFWNQRRKYGEALTPALLWARIPRLFLGVAFLYGMIDRRASPIEPSLRALVSLRVSQINHCRFCVDLNAETLIRRGVSEAKALALEGWRESPLFDDRERVALTWAEAVGDSAGTVSDTLFADLHRLFDDDAIVELTALVAFQSLSSRFNAALGVPPQGLCRLPGTIAAPPPAAAGENHQAAQGTTPPRVGH